MRRVWTLLRRRSTSQHWSPRRTRAGRNPRRRNSGRGAAPLSEMSAPPQHRRGSTRQPRWPRLWDGGVPPGCPCGLTSTTTSSTLIVRWRTSTWRRRSPTNSPQRMPVSMATKAMSRCRVGIDGPLDPVGRRRGCMNWPWSQQPSVAQPGSGSPTVRPCAEPMTLSTPEQWLVEHAANGTLLDLT
jgi:hypothetical protein